MVYLYNEILFSLEKEGKFAISYNTAEPWGHYVRWNKSASKKTNTIWFHSYEVLRIVKIIQTESWMGSYLGTKGGENGESLFNGYGISILPNVKCYRDGWW